MNPHTDIPTGTPTVDPVADRQAPAADPAADLFAAADPAAGPFAAPDPAAGHFAAAGPVADAPRAVAPAPTSQFRLRRSRTDRMLGGVCGGLAESLGADAALLRVLVVALTLITGGAFALIYLAAWVLAPEGDRPAI
jgi:phage shock protein PspC (stress-responsive transcriptional regulator)